MSGLPNKHYATLTYGVWLTMPTKKDCKPILTAESRAFHLDIFQTS